MNNSTEQSDFRDNPNQQLVVALSRETKKSDVEIAGWISTSNSALTADLLDTISGIPVEEIVNDALIDALLTQLLFVASGKSELIEASRIVNCYKHLQPKYGSAHKLLVLLAVQQSSEDLRTLADAVINFPPADPTALAVVFSPLFRAENLDHSALFPRLWEALTLPNVAIAVLDLANYLNREGRVEQHPGYDQRKLFGQLLIGLTSELSRLENLSAGKDKNSSEKKTPTSEELHVRVADGVAFATGLCDALALIGESEAIGKLKPVLALKHRRLRAEAAFALAKLGEEEGREALVTLAAEPVTRVRVIAYARELDIEDQIDEQFTTNEAICESELALYLAQPSQLGIPPTTIELLDSRSLYWPGYDDIEECFLFRFTYNLANGKFTNVGIAGAATHAVVDDLTLLATNEIYACFAGWSTEHNDIYDFNLERLDDSQKLQIAQLMERAARAGFDDLEIAKYSMFFEEKVLVLRATRDKEPGIVIIDSHKETWLGSSVLPSTSADIAYNVYKGRTLLSSFNDFEEFA
jgi:hypothetical protein